MRRELPTHDCTTRAIIDVVVDVATSGDAEET